MGKKVSLVCLVLALSLALSGCRIVRMEKEGRTALDYTVVKQEDVPGEVTALLADKKSNEFQMTYHSGEYLYLIKGYGQQMSGGYSIQVEELSKSNNTVFFRTKLLPPSGDTGGSEPSYPYIVVKMPYDSAPVEFE